MDNEDGRQSDLWEEDQRAVRWVNTSPLLFEEKKVSTIIYSLLIVYRDRNLKGEQLARHHHERQPKCIVPLAFFLCNQIQPCVEHSEHDINTTVKRNVHP
jgi:hypothetical protein